MTVNATTIAVLSPSNGPPGTGVTVSGMIDTPGGSWLLLFGGVQVASGNADPNAQVQTSFSVPIGAQPGSYAVVLQDLQTNTAGTEQFTVVGTTTTSTSSAGTFSLSISPEVVTVTVGGSADFVVTVTSDGSFASTVTLSYSGVPGFVQISFDANQLTPTPNLLSVSTTGHVGVFQTPPTLPILVPITITGAGGGYQGSVTYTLDVEPATTATSTTTTSTSNTTAPPADFVLSNSGPISVVQGAAGSSDLFVTVLTPSTAPVSLTCVAPLPLGVTCNFAQWVEVREGSWKNRITAINSVTTPLGSYTITVLVGVGSLLKTTTIVLTVSPIPGPGDFIITDPGLPAISSMNKSSWVTSI